MRKVLVLLLMAILLSACGGIHENISEDMANDTEQVISIFESAIDEDRDFTEREEAVFINYQAEYNVKRDNPDVYDDEFTEEENRLLILTTNMIDMADSLTLLSSDTENFESNRDRIRRVIETGEIYK